MKTYTKDQLIASMIQYHQNIATNPELFRATNDPNFTIEEKATASVEYLLKIADELHPAEA